MKNLTPFQAIMVKVVQKPVYLGAIYITLIKETVAADGLKLVVTIMGPIRLLSWPYTYS